MAVRDIRLFGDPVLKTASDPILKITEQTRSLIQDLEDTAALPGRAGVAACQIGVNLRAFSYNVEGQIGHLINPEIVEYSGELLELEEGCLSLPEIWSKTPRYAAVVIRGLNQSGDELEIAAEGLLAQVMQHELDHLDGKVYLDRLAGETRKKALSDLRATSWFLS
jgi:peptide deformylase